MKKNRFKVGDLLCFNAAGRKIYPGQILKFKNYTGRVIRLIDGCNYYRVIIKCDHSEYQNYYDEDFLEFYEQPKLEDINIFF